jgi:hypothetical protein
MFYDPNYANYLYSYYYGMDPQAYQQQSNEGQSITASSSYTAQSIYPALDNSQLKKLTKAKKPAKKDQYQSTVDFRTLDKDAIVRTAGGEVWQDHTLEEWDPSN